MPDPVGGKLSGEHKGHLIPEGGVNRPEFVNVRENIASEAPRSNLGLKKSLDIKASKLADENPNSEIRYIADPVRERGLTRPDASSIYITKDGEIIEATTVLNRN